MPDDWVGVLVSTAPNYIKGASDLTQRGRLHMAMMKKRGRFEFNQDGTEMRWDVEYSQPAVQTYGGEGSLSFESHVAYKQYVMPWRGYKATDTMSVLDQLKNKGDRAIVKVFQNKMNQLTKSMRNKLGSEFFNTGDGTGRENAVHGIETFMGTGTTVAADLIAKPDDSYGGIDTDLGVNGGSWSAVGTAPNASVATDWPHGNGDSEYDFNTPKILNWSSTSWDGSSTTFEANAWRVLSQGIAWMSITGGEDGTPDYCPMASNLFQKFKENLEVKQRELIPHKEASDLGFGNTLNMDGVAVKPEFDVAYNTAYLLCMKKVTWSCLTPDLLMLKGPDIDPRSGYSTLWAVFHHGNIKWFPKYTCKIKNVA